MSRTQSQLAQGEMYGKRQDFVIAGYTPSEKVLPDSLALVLGVYDQRKTGVRGASGHGVQLPDRLDLRKKLDPPCPGLISVRGEAEGSRSRHAVWTTPQLVGEVAFTEWTDDGSIVTHRSGSA